MRTNQTLDEAKKYLLYVADALQAIASSHSVDKQDRVVLDKYASELFEYSKNLDQLNNSIVAKDEAKKKLHIVAQLEYIYDVSKKATVKTRENLSMVKARLKEAQETKNESEIDEWKKRVEYYSKLYVTAASNEEAAKIEFQQGS